MYRKKLCFFRTKSILFNFKTDLKSKLLKTNEGKCEICRAEKSCVYNMKHKDRNGGMVEILKLFLILLAIHS